MNTKRAEFRSKTLDNLFGPPPLLEGEDDTAYFKLLARFSNAIRPADFLEEIWVRDAVDVIWNIFRLRRIQAAYLSAEVSDEVNEKVSPLAEAKANLLEGTDKEDMERLLDPNAELSWEQLTEKYPRANEKYQKLWASAEATLNIDEIQARVMVDNLDTIERIEHLIIIEQTRLDAVVRELDRHRVTLRLHNGDQRIEEAKFKIVKSKTAIRKTTNKKAA
jgi:hypothetical protein